MEQDLPRFLCLVYFPPGFHDRIKERESTVQNNAPIFVGWFHI